MPKKIEIENIPQRDGSPSRFFEIRRNGEHAGEVFVSELGESTGYNRRGFNWHAPSFKAAVRFALGR